MVKQIEQTEDSVREINEPIVFQGFFLDADDSFIFLGDTPDEVCSAIKRDEITSIHIAKPQNIFDDVLDSMGEPEDETDIN